jgi:hypothetical protein
MSRLRTAATKGKLLRNRRKMLPRKRVMVTGAFLACFLIGGPAAQATFTTAATATMTASTYVLEAPAGNKVTAECNPIGNSGKYQLRISVTARGTVSKATNYILKMVSPTGTIQTLDLNADGGTYDSGSSSSAARGKWFYSVEAQYRVPETTNVWTSNAPQLSVTC